MLDHIAGANDLEISALLQKDLQKKGITFLLGHSCKEIQPGKVLVGTPEGAVLTLNADKVLLSIGRRANCGGIGLENIGVNFDRSIPTDTQ
jgi:dihydrolipoamide dehydrogenase